MVSGLRGQPLSIGGESFDLTRPLDFMRFPMRAVDKAHFVRLMLRAFGKSDWSDWHDRSAADLVDTWASAGVRETMFEPLTQIKFGMPCSEISGAWLGARLHHREGSAALGYIPGRNWTEVLCNGLAHQLSRLGVRALTKTKIVRVETSKNAVREVETEGGGRIGGDVFVSTMATETLRRLIPEEDSPGIREITYTALTSVICATVQPIIAPEFYWMNLLGKTHTASGLFKLESLNPTLGTLGESYLNFVTHSHSRTQPFFKQSEDDVVEGYKRDFREVFGEELRARWIQVNRIPMYSPVLVRNFKNPPIASTRFGNLFFAGNYRTFPSVVSTGTAMHSGLEAANAIVNSSKVLEVLDKAVRFAPSMFLQA